MIFGAIALLLVALAFVAAELFIPTHGLLTILAVIASLCAIVMAFKTGVLVGLLFILAVFICGPVVFYFAVRIYPTTPMGKRVMLEQPAQGSTTAFQQESTRLEELEGQIGVAVTMLRPAGSIEIAGRRIDAMSDEDVIQPGTRVQVVQVTGLWKVFVKAAE